MPEPFYIAADNRKLYAVYYPAVGTPRSENVLFVPAYGQDQVRVYRALHDSAMRLSRDGCNVLRFDFTGTGNSTDLSTPLTLADWQADVAAALSEVKEISGCRKTVALSLRLGSIVLSELAEEFDRIAFLDPVIRGNDFVSELKDLHAAMCSNPYKYLEPEGKANQTRDELAGHAMPAGLLNDLEQSELTEQFSQLCSYAVSSDVQAVPKLKVSFRKCSCVPFACGWTDVNSLEEMINPQPCFRRLEDLICGRETES